MKIVEEFKTFIMRGNVVDLAVGVIIGAAFGKIVTALVNDLIMPLVSMVLGSVDFTNLYLPLSSKVTQAQADYEAKHPGGHLSLADAKAASLPVLAWGDFVTVTLDFLIVAFCIFLLVKGINTLTRKQEAAPVPTNEEKLLTEIRDLLKSKQA